MNTHDREKHFWNNYIAELSEAQIKPQLHTWYVQHCETFIRRNKDTRLKQHTKKSVFRYLSALVNENKKEPWLKKQVIDSLRLLFKGIHSPLYLEVDWDYWKSSCLDLGKDHDTNYRSTHTIESQTKPSPSSPVQSQQEQEAAANEIDRLRKALRRKNSSIRTEKSYTDWVKQFLKFNACKNSTDVGQQWVWQYVFPSYKLSVDPRSGIIRRHHINESTIQKRIRILSRKLEISKRVTCHAFRHSYATHLLERGSGRLLLLQNRHTLHPCR